jgi:hypothetical protein
LSQEHDLEEMLTGLSDSEAEVLRAQHGKNLVPEKIVPLWYMIVKQLIGPMPYMIEGRLATFDTYL